MIMMVETVVMMAVVMRVVGKIMNYIVMDVSFGLVIVNSTNVLKMDGQAHIQMMSVMMEEEMRIVLFHYQ